MTTPYTTPTTVPRVALITQAVNPLGQALAHALAKKKWHLALQHTAADTTLHNLALACEEHGVQTMVIATAFDTEQTIKASFLRISQTLGHIDCLINNTGHQAADNVKTFCSETFNQHIHANLLTPLLLIQGLYASTYAREAAQAVVINFLDQAVFEPASDFLSYTLSQAALHKAITLLAQSCAPQLRITGIATQHAPNQTQLDDISATVCFLAHSTGITGSTVCINQGQHLYPHHATIANTAY